MKVISGFIHGMLDYIFVIFLLSAPFMFDLSDFITTVVLVLGGIHLLLSILTDYDLGVFRWIPMAAHGLIELIVAILLVASPWLLQVSDQPTDRNFLITIAVFVLAVWVMTDYRQKYQIPEE